MGVGHHRDIKGKADDDYAKRKKNPGPLDPAKTTFVFVTPRRWGKKKEWEEGRRSEGFWVDVRAYDADNIEQWTELASAVGAWLAALIGKYPAGAEVLLIAGVNSPRQRTRRFQKTSSWQVAWMLPRK